MNEGLEQKKILETLLPIAAELDYPLYVYDHSARKLQAIENGAIVDSQVDQNMSPHLNDEKIFCNYYSEGNDLMMMFFLRMTTEQGRFIVIIKDYKQPSKLNKLFIHMIKLLKDFFEKNDIKILPAAASTATSAVASAPAKNDESESKISFLELKVNELNKLLERKTKDYENQLDLLKAGTSDGVSEKEWRLEKEGLIEELGFLKDRLEKDAREFNEEKLAIMAERDDYKAQLKSDSGTKSRALVTDEEHDNLVKERDKYKDLYDGLLKGEKSIPGKDYPDLRVEMSKVEAERDKYKNLLEEFTKGDPTKGMKRGSADQTIDQITRERDDYKRRLDDLLKIDPSKSMSPDLTAKLKDAESARDIYKKELEDIRKGDSKGKGALDGDYAEQLRQLQAEKDAAVKELFTLKNQVAEGGGIALSGDEELKKRIRQLEDEKAATVAEANDLMHRILEMEDFTSHIADLEKQVRILEKEKQKAVDETEGIKTLMMRGGFEAAAAASSDRIDKSEKESTKLKSYERKLKKLTEKNALYEEQMAIFEEQKAALSKEVEKLTAESAKLSVELDTLKSSNTAGNQSVDSLNQEVARLTGEISKLNSNIAELEKERDSAVAKAKELEKELKEAGERIETLESELADSTALADDLRAQKQDVLAEADDLRSQKEALATELEGLKDATGAQEKLSAEHRLLADKYDITLTSIREKDMRINELTGELSRLEANHKTLLADMDDLRLKEKELGNISEGQIRLEDEKRTLSDEKEKLARDKDRLRSENEKLISEKDKLTVEKIRLINEKGQLNEEKDQLNEKYEKLIDENELLTTARDKLNLEKDKLSTEKSRLSEENEKLSSLGERLENEKKKLAIEKDSLTREMERLAGENSKLSEERDKLSVRKDRLNSEKEKLVEERDALILDKKGFTEERNRLTVELERLAGENDKLFLEKDQHSTESARLAEELGKISQERELFSGEKTRLEDELAKHITENRQMIDALEALRAEKELSASKLAELIKEKDDAIEYAEKRIKSLEGDIESNDRMTQSLRDEKEKAEKDAKELRKRLDEARQNKKSGELELQLHDAQIERDKAQAELQSLGAQLRELKSSDRTAELSVRIDELERERKSVMDEAESLRQRLEAFQAEIQPQGDGEAAIMLRAAESEISKLKEEVATCNRKMERLNKEMQLQDFTKEMNYIGDENRDELLKKVYERSAELEQENLRLKESLPGSDEYNKAKMELDKAKQELSKMSLLLDEYRNELEDIKKKTTEPDVGLAEIERLKSENEALRDGTGDSQQVIEEQARIIEELSRQLRELTDEIKTYSQHHGELQSALTEKESQMNRLHADMQENIRSIEALSGQREKLVNLFNGLFLPVFAMNATYEVQTANRALLDFAKQSDLEEARKEPCYKTVYGFDEPCKWCQMKQVTEMKQDARVSVVVGDKALELAFAPVFDAWGEITGVSESITDRSEVYSLSQSMEKFKEKLNSFKDDRIDDISDYNELKKSYEDLNIEHEQVTLKNSKMLKVIEKLMNEDKARELLTVRSELMDVRNKLSHSTAMIKNYKYQLDEQLIRYSDLNRRTFLQMERLLNILKNKSDLRNEEASSVLNFLSREFEFVKKHLVDSQRRKMISDSSDDSKSGIKSIQEKRLEEKFALRSDD